MPHLPLSPLSSSQASVHGVDGFATLQPRHRFQAKAPFSDQRQFPCPHPLPLLREAEKTL